MTGLYTQAGSSSLLFLQFLEQLFTDINSLIGKSLQPRNGFAYSSVVIAAHSLGAVVTRRALLEAARDSPSWIHKRAPGALCPGSLGCVCGSTCLCLPDVARLVAGQNRRRRGGL